MNMLSRKHMHRGVSRDLRVLVILGFLFGALPAVAVADQVIPWECTGFTGEAQTRCVHIFMELQQEKIHQLEQSIKNQEREVQSLQAQVARQSSAREDLERKLRRKQRDWWSRPSVQIVPPLGLAFRFGKNRYWDRSFFFGQPYYYGPRFFGHRYRLW